MNDYTPGPWRVGTNGPNGLLTVGTERGLMVAMVAHSIYVPDQAEQARGDARLIAAAPDLLAAAEGVLRSSHSGCACFECGQLAAAIKKAKGQ